MSTLLEISGNDIAQLGDGELRELIGLLCEADYHLAGLPTSGITWGGHQNAPDGGLDVVVRDTVSPPETSFVPRRTKGFQVRASDMPRSKIIEEMCPDGRLRESIKELIQENGAYIIVSSKGSVADKPLKNRISAMKEAVADEIGLENSQLDFFDRGRVATWVRSHPSLVLWVRNKIGKPFSGWRPYENWARARGGVKEVYLIGDELRLHDGDARTEQGLNVVDGIVRLRSILSMPRKCVRLVGLSGVGKTRLVQALFDDRIREKALKQNVAFYTDVADSPDPDPASLANQLINDEVRAILIIDNCPPDLHRRLAQICSDDQSTASLLTIEYDVRDDIPEETSVFRLEPASENIIEKLISQQYVHISQVDAATIAKFSGGNARVAIVLADTVTKGDTLSGLRDEELFERLFRQRNLPDENLLISAQACSLVYSFEGTDTTSEESEIKFLASLINMSPTDLYRDIDKLKRRDLIQSRDVWRALLPQAIANRLAKRALEAIPKDVLVNRFITNSERLIKSFSRRLGFLHDSEVAINIVNDWLKQDGWIGKEIDNLNNFGIQVLNNIAPVSPDKTLDAIEIAANGNNGSVFLSRNNPHISKFIRLLRHLAYEPALFNRSVGLLCRFALSEYMWSKNGARSQAVGDNPQDTLLLGNYGNQRYVQDELKSLFYLYLSGTHAPVEARTNIVENLIDSEDDASQNIGINLLDAMLETWHFTSSREFEFGARSRDEGYRPKSREDEIHWYETAVNICMRIALTRPSIAEQAKKILADNLRGLWSNMGMFEYLEDVAKKIREQGAWNYGWIAVSGIIRYDSESFNDEVKQRLYKLKELLRPDNLSERARTFVLSDQHGRILLEDGFDDEESEINAIDHIEDEARKIGFGVAQDNATLNVLLPDIVSTANSRLFNFGIGLAEGSTDKKSCFKKLYNAFEKTSPERRQIGVILGFLGSCAKLDPVFYNSTLDRAVKDEVLGDWFPAIQISPMIDQRGVERLHEALDSGKAKLDLFIGLARGQAHKSISDDDLASILNKILTKKDGVYLVLEILRMRFHGKETIASNYSDGLMTVARETLVRFPFDNKQTRHIHRDYGLAKIVSVCHDGSKGCQAIRIMCRNFARANLHSYISHDFTQLLNTLAMVQPTIFLDEFLDNSDIEDIDRRYLFTTDNGIHKNPINQISDDVLSAWCEENPSSRFPLVASVLELFKLSNETEKYEWHPFIYTIFDKAPVLEIVLECLNLTERRTYFRGPRADIFQKFAKLYEDLYEHENDLVVAWAKNQYSKLQEKIVRTHEWENQLNRERDRTFE